mmetsp:Transcript_67708/g.181073  ORF Transcript_67708/g.181073 Transcript_67708/m.181073 type:complete len:212 (+) Transcript_67708:1848-2483(+)
MFSCLTLISSDRFSSWTLISRISCSSRSRLRCSRSMSDRFLTICDRRVSRSTSCACFSWLSTRHRSCRSTISLRAVTSCWVRLSRSAVSSSFCFVSSLTAFSWPSVRPASAPHSPRSRCMASRTAAPRSRAASTIFQALSSSSCSDAMVLWSSSSSFRIAAPVAARSLFNLRHFPRSCFSVSCDFLNALKSFSYSFRNRSNDLSPTSCKTS